MKIILRICQVLGFIPVVIISIVSLLIGLIVISLWTVIYYIFTGKEFGFESAYREYTQGVMSFIGFFFKGIE